MHYAGLIARLEHYIPLSAKERDSLASSDEPVMQIKAGSKLVDEGGSSDDLYIVQHGWIHSSVRLADGGRQILGFHYAGDLIGTSSIAWSRAAATLTAVSDSVVSALSRKRLGQIFVHQPRLAALLYAVAAAENVAMSDRLTSIGRMGSTQRLATLLLDMLARLRVTADGVIDSFDLPLTQSDIGDALGLTKVHVNRTIRALEHQGMIERTGRRIRILKEAELVRETGFVDRYGKLQIDWLPSAAEYA